MNLATTGDTSQAHSATPAACICRTRADRSRTRGRQAGV